MQPNFAKNGVFRQTAVVSKPNERQYSEKTDTEKSNFDIFTKTYGLTLATHRPTRMF